MSAAALVDHIDHFQRRVLADALTEAAADYWRRRGDAFEAAMPRAGDFPGRCTPDELDARRQRLASVALACRQRAAVSLIGGAL